MSKILWSRQFIEAQGYNISHNILMQDRNSDIILSENGKFSRSKRNKHIKTRYLFVMHIVAQDELKIDHCTVERTWANILTKPFQGRTFRDLKE